MQQQTNGGDNNNVINIGNEGGGNDAQSMPLLESIAETSTGVETGTHAASRGNKLRNTSSMPKFIRDFMDKREKKAGTSVADNSSSTNLLSPGVPTNGSAVSTPATLANTSLQVSNKKISYI